MLTVAVLQVQKLCKQRIVKLKVWTFWVIRVINNHGIDDNIMIQYWKFSMVWLLSDSISRFHDIIVILPNPILVHISMTE